MGSVHKSGAQAAKKSLDFNISLQGSIEKGEFLILGIGDKKYLFGNPSKKYIKKYNLNLIEIDNNTINNIDDFLPRELLKFGVSLS